LSGWTVIGPPVASTIKPTTPGANVEFALNFRVRLQSDPIEYVPVEVGRCALPSAYTDVLREKAPPAINVSVPIPEYGPNVVPSELFAPEKVIP
jgi:hypothetical protein